MRNQSRADLLPADRVLEGARHGNGTVERRGKVAWSGSPLAVALAPRHYFYDRCNEVLAEAEFDEVVEMLCQPYYKDGVGRPSIPPGRYFRML